MRRKVLEERDRVLRDWVEKSPNVPIRAWLKFADREYPVEGAMRSLESAEKAVMEAVRTRGPVYPQVLEADLFPTKAAGKLCRVAIQRLLEEGILVLTDGFRLEFPESTECSGDTVELLKEKKA